MRLSKVIFVRLASDDAPCARPLTLGPSCSWCIPKSPADMHVNYHSLGQVTFGDTHPLPLPAAANGRNEPARAANKCFQLSQRQPQLLCLQTVGKDARDGVCSHSNITATPSCAAAASDKQHLSCVPHAHTSCSGHATIPSEAATIFGVNTTLRYSTVMHQ